MLQIPTPTPCGYCLRRSCLRSLCNHKQVCIALTYSQHSLLLKRENFLLNSMPQHFSTPTRRPKLPLFGKRGERQSLGGSSYKHVLQHFQLLPPSGTPSCSRGRIIHTNTTPTRLRRTSSLKRGRVKCHVFTLRWPCPPRQQGCR